MKRRSRAGSVKTRRRKSAAPKRASGTEAARPRSSSAASQESEIALLVRERNETAEQLAAASNVLKTISSSLGDLKPVFTTILENATRICAANFGVLHLYESGGFRIGATHNAPSAFADAVARRDPIFRPSAAHPLARVAATKQIVHVFDLSIDEAYKRRDPGAVRLVELASARSLIAVPMLKDGKLIGDVVIYRQEVRPFTKSHIELVQNFATQAVIAIANARLLNELRRRTSDLTESLEQQTATSEVLKVISSSPGELDPVFQTMLAKAIELCEASYGAMWLREGDTYRNAAFHGDLPPAFVEQWRSGTTYRPRSDVPLALAIQTRQPAQVADMRTSPSYLARDPLSVSAVEVAGIRTLVAVPLLRENEPIGTVAVYRKEVRPFTNKQIALVQNFAAQAVIAIENTRLLSELRQSLQQQTATAEVLKVISRSTFDLRAVLQTLVESAARFCAADKAVIIREKGGGFYTAEAYGYSHDFMDYIKNIPIKAERGSASGRALLEGRVVHIADVKTDAEYTLVEAQRLGDYRTILCVPMLREGVPIGILNLTRSEVRSFTDKQIELVSTFADQAAIAIENARLLKELRERTKQLEAQSREVTMLNQQLEQRVADQVGEIERMSRLRRFLPPQVADLIVASGTEKQLESHRREITALFCDLRGFTGFSESSDPEDVIALLRDYHAAIGQIIVKYSGTLERFAGDGVMVIFNDPVPVKNPALQAVLMALDMRTAIGTMIEKWRDLGHDLGFGIGIAHGFATLGTIGFEGRFDYAAIGTVSNVASRLCDEAKPGQILVSPRVRQAIDKAVTVESVGEFALKGIRRPMMAFNVLEASPSKLN